MTSREADMQAQAYITYTTKNVLPEIFERFTLTMEPVDALPIVAPPGETVLSSSMGEAGSFARACIQNAPANLELRFAILPRNKHEEL